MGIAQAGRGPWTNTRKRHVARTISWRGTVLKAVGAATLIGISAACGFAGMLFYSGQHLDGESRQFADSAIADIGRDWDLRSLESHAAPQLLKAASPAQLQGALQGFARLGHLTNYSALTGQANMVMVNWSSTITARYSANAQFENGTALMTLGLIKEDGQWMIMSLTVAPTSPIRNAATHAL